MGIKEKYNEHDYNAIKQILAFQIAPKYYDADLADYVQVEGGFDLHVDVSCDEIFDTEVELVFILMHN